MKKEWIYSRRRYRNFLRNNNDTIKLAPLGKSGTNNRLFSLLPLRRDFLSIYGLRYTNNVKKDVEQN